MSTFEWTLAPENLAGALPAVLLLIVVAAILHDDLTCVLVGVYVAQGDIPFWPSLLACFLGTLLGDLAWFLSARIFGRLMLDRRPVKWLITVERLARAQAMFDRYGASAIIVTRFLPGARTPVQIAAGLLSSKILTDCLFFMYAAALYAPLLVGSSALFGQLVNVESLYRQYGHLVLFGAAATVWLALVLLKFTIRRLNAGRVGDESG